MGMPTPRRATRRRNMGVRLAATPPHFLSHHASRGRFAHHASGHARATPHARLLAAPSCRSAARHFGLGGLSALISSTLGCTRCAHGLRCERAWGRPPGTSWPTCRTLARRGPTSQARNRRAGRETSACWLATTLGDGMFAPAVVWQPRGLSPSRTRASSRKLSRALTRERKCCSEQPFLRSRDESAAPPGKRCSAGRGVHAPRTRAVRRGNARSSARGASKKCCSSLHGNARSRQRGASRARLLLALAR